MSCPTQIKCTDGMSKNVELTTFAYKHLYFVPPLHSFISVLYLYLRFCYLVLSALAPLVTFFFREVAGFKGVDLEYRYVPPPCFLARPLTKRVINADNQVCGCWGWCRG